MLPKVKSLLITILFAAGAFGQGSEWQATVPAVDQPGLYAIRLSPELLGRSQKDLADLRLIDSTGMEIPYVLRISQGPTKRSEFVEYDMLRNEVLPEQTVIEFERPPEKELEGVHIWIRPADVQKHVRITASDDQQQWYMVKDEHLVTKGSIGDPPHQVLMVNFPRSDYRYYRIQLNDSLTPPMQIMGVGYFVEQEQPQRFVPAGSLQWEQVEKGDRTYLNVTSSFPIRLDRLKFTVEDEQLYRRNGSIEIKERSPVKPRRRQRVSESARTVEHFVLASDARTVEIDPLIADSFSIVIENGDDRPLEFTSIEGDAAEHLLLARLESVRDHSLTTGDPNASVPKYDLVHFEKSLEIPLDIIQHSSPRPLSRAHVPLVFDPSGPWLWVIIIALMCGMALLAVRMLREPNTGM